MLQFYPDYDDVWSWPQPRGCKCCYHFSYRSCQTSGI